MRARLAADSRSPAHEHRRIAACTTSPRNTTRSRTTRAACRAGARAAATTRSSRPCSGCAATKACVPRRPSSSRASAAPAACPHYMRTYGFHGIHGRALPIAEGIKLARPDLNVFVNTGDGDCCSIGAAHWIHAIRYNMNITVLLHDNHIYGLTKKQASPTSPIGTRSNTHAARLVPRGVEPADGDTRRAERLVRRAGRGLDTGVAVPDHHRGLPASRIFVRAHPAALPRVRRQHVRAVGARSAAHADADARERPAREPGAREDLPQPAASTIPRTSTVRAKSRPATIRSPSASCTATPKCRATKTCAVRASCARPPASARRSMGNSTNSPSGRNDHGQPT